jgi:deoxyribodipyrimidine photolyase
MTEKEQRAVRPDPARFVPELARVPAEKIHRLPPPILDHLKKREVALTLSHATKKE